MIKLKSASKLEFARLIPEIVKEYANQIVIYGVEADPSIATSISQAALDSALPNGIDTPNQYVHSIYHNQNKIGYIWYLVRDQQTAVIGMIFIEPKYRNNGFGHQVVEQLEILCKSQKLSRIVLGVFKENKIALSLYLKHGYMIEKLIAIRPEYQPHKYMMYKDLNLIT